MTAVEQHADLADPRQARALDQFDQSQRDRLAGYLARDQNTDPSVPTILWLAMIAGGLLLVAYLCAFARPRTRLLLQAYTVGAVALVAALNLCVIRFLDTPFLHRSRRRPPHRDALRPRPDGHPHPHPPL